MSHTVVNKYHSRVNDEGKVERFEVGDQIEPTEDELAAFPDRFREMDAPRRGRGRPARTELFNQEPDTPDNPDAP